MNTLPRLKEATAHIAKLERRGSTSIRLVEDGYLIASIREDAIATRIVSWDEVEFATMTNPLIDAIEQMK